jgi:hypothetical protein
MKSLAALVILAALASPAPAQTVTDEKDAQKSADALKKRFQDQRSDRRTKAEIDAAIRDNDTGVPVPPAARPGGSAKAAAGEGEEAPLRSSSKLGMPALYARYAKGLNGYTLEHLVKNLDYTQKNLNGLVDYLHPYQKGVAAPEGDDAALAQKYLAQESAAADAMIADGDAALAKGIPRDPAPDPKDSMAKFRARPLGYLSRPIGVYKNPTPEQKLWTVAAAQANVVGHLGALIELKRLNPPDAEGEANTEKWLESARKTLAEVRR